MEATRAGGSLLVLSSSTPVSSFLFVLWLDSGGYHKLSSLFRPGGSSGGCFVGVSSAAAAAVVVVSDEKDLVGSCRCRIGMV